MENKETHIFLGRQKWRKLDRRAKFTYVFLVCSKVKDYFCYAKCENHAVFAPLYLQTK